MLSPSSVPNQISWQYQPTTAPLQLRSMKNPTISTCTSRQIHAIHLDSLPVWSMESSTESILSVQMKTTRQDISKHSSNTFVHVDITNNPSSHTSTRPDKAKNYNGPVERNNDALKDALFFHMPYHPNNLPSNEIQYLWHKHVVDPNPPYTIPLWEMKNWKGKKCGLRRLIVAYHRPPNLGNILSSRKIRDTDGPNVSTFMV